jgi:8-oxo-dGTP diphosphatase
LKYVKYTIASLLTITEEEFVKALYEHTEHKPYDSSANNVKKEKIESWRNCVTYLKYYFSDPSIEVSKDISICFEYEIYDSTWIDAVIISKNRYLILEFKSGSDCRMETLNKHRVQIDGYYNKISRCNKNVWNEVKTNSDFKIKKYLIYTNPIMRGKPANLDYIKVGDDIRDIIYELTEPENASVVDRLLEFNEELDLTTMGIIRDILKRNLLNDMFVQDENVNACSSIIEDLMKKSGLALNIVFVKGAPGTGKTGTGFSLLEKYLDSNAKYVTGNGNLSSIFRQMINTEKIVGTEAAAVGSLHQIYDLRRFCERYKNGNKNVESQKISNDILIVDEAQRMWNPLQMAIDKRSNFSDEYIQYILEKGLSEAFVVLHSMINGIIDKGKSKTVIFLLGSGQEIYLGEEDGEECITKAIIDIASMLQRLNLNIHLNVYAPDMSLLGGFQQANVSCEVRTELYLKENKRNVNSKVSLDFVDALLDGKTDVANGIGKNLKDELYLYNDIEEAKRSLSELCNIFSYGIVMNSYDGDFDNKIKENSYQIGNATLKSISNNDLYDFYINKQGNKLTKYASQFNCQGLELDYTLMIWGDIFKRVNGRWIISNKEIYAIKNYCKSVNAILDRHPKLQDKVKRVNENEIRENFIKNCYRVLLTRARISTVVYVEDHETYQYISNLLAK